MDSVTKAITLSDEASRAQVALAYGLIGLFVGAFFFKNNGY